MAVHPHIATFWRGGRHHARQGRRRHLATRHAVDRVIDKEHGDLLASIGSVNDLGRADGGQVAVSLIGKDDFVRLGALQAGGHGRRAAVRGLYGIQVEVMIHEHRAADRRDQDRLLLNAQLVYRFGDQAMDDAMRATGAIVRPGVGEGVGATVHDVALLDNLFGR